MGADELLAEAIEAHGGAAYDAAAEVTARVQCGGWAFPLRFKRGAFSNVIGTVSTMEPRVTFSPYPGEGRRGVFDHGAVRIEDGDGEVIAERSDPRPLFRRFRRDGFEVTEAEPWRENGQSWRGLRVRFPDDVPAHSREQLYYFDDHGMLRRNDYTAEVFSRWAKATHYCWDHEWFDGILVPTRRRAMPRRGNGKPLRQVAVVSIAIADVALA